MAFFFKKLNLLEQCKALFYTARSLESIENFWADDEDTVSQNEELIQARFIDTNTKEWADSLVKRQEERQARVKKVKAQMLVKTLAAFFVYWFGWAVVLDQVVRWHENGVVPPGWTFVDALYYVIVSVTTVGYGDFNFLMMGNGLRFLFVVQSFSGFVLFGLLGAEVMLAEKKAEAKKDFIVRGKGEENHPDDDIDIVLVEMKKTVWSVLLMWLLGTIFYRYVEGGGLKAANGDNVSAGSFDEYGDAWGTAWYFTWVSMSTIGFGDVCVQTDGAKIFTCFFLLFSCGYVVTLVNGLCDYKIKVFEHMQMQKLLGLKHNGSRMALFDTFKDGHVTSGELLLGYLVTLGKVRSITATEILAKFRLLSLGKRFIDLNMFSARGQAVQVGLVAGRAAAKAAKAEGKPELEQVKLAGAAAGQAAAEHVWPYHLADLDDAEVKAMEALPRRSYVEIKQSSSIEDINSLEASLEKMLAKCRAAKNYHVKVALAAGTVAGTVARAHKMPIEAVGKAAAAAAKAAGGTPTEMKIAAGDSMAEVVKAKGGQEGEYRWQMKARDDAAALVDAIEGGGAAGGEAKSAGSFKGAQVAKNKVAPQ